MIDLKDLPNYINSIRSGKIKDDGMVVNIGQIKSNSNKNTIWVFALSFVLLASGVVAYSALTKDITIVSNSSEDLISSMVSSSGGRVLNIEKKDGAYKVKIITFRISSFFDRLRKNKEIEKADIYE